LWNKEIRRCEAVDIAKKMREARLRWYGHINQKRFRRTGQRHGITRSDEDVRW
jgi:hypothetical protein